MEFYEHIQKKLDKTEIKHIAHFGDIVEWEINYTDKSYAPVLRGGKVVFAMLESEGGKEMVEQWKKYKQK
jgi:hypothetical protein